MQVRGHDFKDKEPGHAIPYGVYERAADEGWVSVGITSDTAEFAVNSIISWWEHLGKQRHPAATVLPMLRLPSSLSELLLLFAPCFSRPTFERFRAPVLGRISPRPSCGA